jgi:quercetin dioxygenase-like cupin family protein
MEAHSLAGLAAEQISLARSAGNGRAAHTIHGGREHILRQTVLALAAGHGLADHEAPGEASLQVLVGHVRLGTAAESCDARTGDYLVIPSTRHNLDAVEDSAVLLTVVTAGSA